MSERFQPIEASFQAIALSHARSIHCDVIAMDLHGEPQPEHRECPENFILPNDKGALLETSTCRLPLDRHTCAEMLWRFFGDLGEFDCGAGLTTQLLMEQRRVLEWHVER